MTRPANRPHLHTPVGVLAVIALAGCGLLGPMPDPPFPPAFEGRLSPTSSDGGVAGVAYVYSLADRTRISIRVEGGTPGTRLLWRIRTGSCAEQAGITFGTAATYPSIAIRNDGIGRTSTTFDIPINLAAAYRVEVQGGGDPPVTLGCGDLRPTTE